VLGAATDASTLGAALGAATLGAVVALLEQAAATMATPATRAANRICRFIGCLILLWR
jgi:hypothetical protein